MKTFRPVAGVGGLLTKAGGTILLSEPPNVLFRIANVSGGSAVGHANHGLEFNNFISIVAARNCCGLMMQDDQEPRAARS